MACAASSQTAAPPGGVDGTKMLSGLAPGDKQALCDWIAAQFGGYDSRGVCADSATGGLQGPVSQSGCEDQLLDYAHCTATVAQLQACVVAEVSNACNPPSAPPTPECRVLAASCNQGSDAAPG
jgi:hypothetical protein